MKKLPLICVFLVFLSIFVYSGYRILHKMGEYKQIADTHNSIVELVVETVLPITTEETQSVFETDSKNQDADHLESTTENELPVETSAYDGIVAPIKVDFDTLCEINSDVVGWIYCGGTVINYPVLKGENNDAYLYHQYDGTYSPGGSIFMDYRCEGDFSDDYTIIYGHNMLADSMFNCLDYFRNETYLQEHSRFFYLTPDGKNYCLEVVCVNLTAYKDELRLFELRDDERNLELIRGSAVADTGIEVSNDDQLVLLATCTYDFKNAKCTLLCKVVELQ